MKERETHCAVCGCTDTWLLSPSYQENRPLRINRAIHFCNVCGLVFKNKAVPDALARRHWKSLTINRTDEEFLSYEKAVEDRLRTIARTIVDFLDAADFEVQNVLDVGTHTGYFLKIFADIYKASGATISPGLLQLHGVDPIESAILSGRRRHPQLVLRLGRFEDVKLPTRYYHLITLLEVIYRFRDLNKLFEKVLGALKDGGKLAILIDFYFKDYALQETTNSDHVNLFGWFGAGQHMEYYFNKQNFEYLISRHCEIDGCLNIGESNGYLYILSPKQSGIPKNGDSTKHYVSDAASALRYLSEYAENLSSIDIEEFFDAHREIGRIVVVSSDRSGTDLVEYCKKYAKRIAILGLVKIEENSDALRVHLDQLTRDIVGLGDVAIFASSLSHSETISQVANQLGIPCFRTLIPGYEWPYETQLDNRVRIVWYSHLPHRLPRIKLPKPLRKNQYKRWTGYLPVRLKRAVRRVLRH